MSSSIAPLLKSKRKDLGLSVREVLAKLHEDGIDVSDKNLVRLGKWPQATRCRHISCTLPNL